MPIDGDKPTALTGTRTHSAPSDSVGGQGSRKGVRRSRTMALSSNIDDRLDDTGYRLLAGHPCPAKTTA